MRRLPLWLLAFAALGLAGCASGTGSGSAAGSSAGSPSAAVPASGPAGGAPSASASPPVPLPGGTAVLVQFGRQGGIAGVNDQLTVRADGGYTISRTRPAVNRSGNLSAADLAELRRVLEQSNFANLPKVQPAKGADLFTYQVSYAGNQVLAMDGGVDERLKPVISTLSGLMAKYSG